MRNVAIKTTTIIAIADPTVYISYGGIAIGVAVGAGVTTGANPTTMPVDAAAYQVQGILRGRNIIIKP
jgi:hypothetical protein